MPRKQADIFYIYKTTCLVTGRYYIGMHATANINDGYMGSGKRLRYSIRKHGKENHVKEILEYLPSKEKLIEREIELITSEMLCDTQCMNLMSGGTGGFISIEHQRHRSSCGGKAHQARMLVDVEYRQYVVEKQLIGRQRAIAEGRWSNKVGGWNKRRNLTSTHKQNIGKANTIKQKGELNSQYGRCWVTKDGVNKSILKDEYNNYKSNGWKKGKSYLNSLLIEEMQKFYEAGNSYQKTADHFGIPKTTIRKYLKKQL